MLLGLKNRNDHIIFQNFMLLGCSLIPQLSLPLETWPWWWRLVMGSLVLRLREAETNCALAFPKLFWPSQFPFHWVLLCQRFHYFIKCVKSYLQHLHLLPPPVYSRVDSEGWRWRVLSSQPLQRNFHYSCFIKSFHIVGQSTGGGGPHPLLSVVRTLCGR